MKIVVTGAFGYLGLALLRALRAAGHEVVGVGHLPRAPVELPAGVEAVHGDLLLAVPHIPGAGAVIHLAGGGGEAACRRDPALAVRTIALGTSVLAAAAREAGARLIFASSIAVYGTFRDHGRPYSEDDPIAPDDLYGSLKATAGHIVRAVAAGTALRIANIYGAGFGVDLGINGAVERFARAAARGEEMTLFGDGSQRIDYVHIDDVVAAICAALTVESLPAAINIGGGAPVSIYELADLCGRAGQELGTKPQIVMRPAPEGKIWPDRSLAIDLAARVLDWRPRVRLEDGIRELVAMMKGST
jgi:UDP-glucose 4-epimerase